MSHRFVTDHAVPPGETLAELLSERKMSQSELARQLGTQRQYVHQVIHGHCKITPRIAGKLQELFKTPASFWINLEANYTYDLARLGLRRPR